MSTAVTIPIYDSNVPLLPVSGNTPFGYYDNDVQFQLDAPSFVKFVTRRLGYPILDVELQDINMYAAFEDATTVYSKELYEYKIRENYLSMEGSPTGSTDINNTLIQPSLGNIIRLAKDYGSEAGSGGNLTYYTGSLPMTAGRQTYDLDYYASASGLIQAGDSIEVKKIFYEATPAIMRIYDPYSGTGTGMLNLLDSFGFGNMSPGINFMLMPIYGDVLRIQAIEFNDQIRKSAFSFELINNKLRIFPIPSYDKNLFFTFIKNSERNALSRGPVNTGLITNISGVPYNHITYSQINNPGRKWIFDYGLSVCKEILGNIRSKYSNQPLPGGEMVIVGQGLLDQAVKEQDALVTQLRATLEDTSRRNQMQKKSEETEMMNQTLNQVPMCIYIG